MEHRKSYVAFVSTNIIRSVWSSWTQSESSISVYYFLLFSTNRYHKAPCKNLKYNTNYLIFSEGPFQAAMIILKYLSIKFEGKGESEMENFCLSYDNICNVDSLKLLQKPLPMAPPNDKLWISIKKVIDPLHYVLSHSIIYQKSSKVNHYCDFNFHQKFFTPF